MKTVGSLTLTALLGTTLFAAQVGLSLIPNIELVSLLILLYCTVFPFWQAFSAVLVFNTLEALLWGFGEWVIGYFVVWPLLILLVFFLKPMIQDKASRWALLLAAFGLGFGALFALVHMVLFGVHTGLAYWLAGVPFDIIHGVGNYILTLLLYDSLRKPLTWLFQRTIKA